MRVMDDEANTPTPAELEAARRFLHSGDKCFIPDAIIYGDGTFKLILVAAYPEMEA